MVRGIVGSGLSVRLALGLALAGLLACGAAPASAAVTVTPGEQKVRDDVMKATLGVEGVLTPSA